MPVFSQGRRFQGDAFYGSEVGLEPAIKRRFNNMQVSG
jgi:hypothetical protein